MTEQKPALVLHLAGGGEPLLFALPPEDATKLEEQLSHHLRSGAVASIPTKDGSTVSINFTHVAAAYIDDVQRKGKIFGY